MPPELTFETRWEGLASGSPEESATFGEFIVRFGAVALTEGYDHYARRLRDGPLVAAYPAAEWIAWNWWRLRWEPRRRDDPEWAIVHDMSAIGEGYSWPRIRFVGDGERMAIEARASSAQEERPYRYTRSWAAICPARDFERAVDDFVRETLDRLSSCDLKATNLHRLWKDLTEERADPGVAEERRLEALMGREPGDGAGDIAALRNTWVGASGLMDEVAALGANRLGATDIASIGAAALELGEPVADWSPALQLLPQVRREKGEPAWELGKRAAHLARAAMGVREGKVTGPRLSEFSGTRRLPLVDKVRSRNLPFSVVHGGRVLLRASNPTSQRFAFARLLGDMLMFPNFVADPGHQEQVAEAAATDVYTYRQKAQRSFAAELLCPIAELLDRVEDDMNDENLQAVAEDFGVSELTVRTLLVNHGHLSRQDLLPDPEYRQAI